MVMAGNLGPIGAVKTRPGSWSDFDRLPKAIRKWLTTARLDYSAAGVRQAWNLRRKSGWTIKQFLELCEERDRLNYASTLQGN